MPRTELKRLVVSALFAASFGAPGALDPHLDPAKVPGGCRACHDGHGRPGSPMLKGPVSEVCLACHDTRARADQEVQRGRLAPDASPSLIGTALALPFSHPLDRKATSRFEPAAVTCTSCHSPHRSSASKNLRNLDSNRPRPSTRNRNDLEYELCAECHGHGGPSSRDPNDIGRLLDPDARSFHPVKAPTRERAPSTIDARQAGQVSCSECHGTSAGAGSRGLHGSANSPLLTLSYTSVDGARDGSAGHALCFACHDKEKVLDSPRFPLHRDHVEKQKASCATCHSAHGSIRNRALIRFGEETTVAGVMASLATGKLLFESDAPGSGACYLTCHGVDHGPKPYGAARTRDEMLRGRLRGRSLAPTPGAPTGRAPVEPGVPVREPELPGEIRTPR